MKKLRKIEILENGRIQAVTKIMHELKDGSFLEGENHRLAYNPGEGLGDDDDSDLVDDNGLLKKALEMIPEKLKEDFKKEQDEIKKRTTSKDT